MDALKHIALSKIAAVKIKLDEANELAVQDLSDWCKYFCSLDSAEDVSELLTSRSFHSDLKHLHETIIAYLNCKLLILLGDDSTPLFNIHQKMNQAVYLFHMDRQSIGNTIHHELILAVKNSRSQHVIDYSRFHRLGYGSVDFASVEQAINNVYTLEQRFIDIEKYAMKNRLVYKQTSASSNTMGSVPMDIFALMLSYLPSFKLVQLRLMNSNMIHIVSQILHKRHSIIHYNRSKSDVLYFMFGLQFMGSGLQAYISRYMNDLFKIRMLHDNNSFQIAELNCKIIDELIHLARSKPMVYHINSTAPMVLSKIPQERLCLDSTCSSVMNLSIKPIHELYTSQLSICMPKANELHILEIKQVAISYSCSTRYKKVYCYIFYHDDQNRLIETIQKQTNLLKMCLIGMNELKFRMMNKGVDDFVQASINERFFELAL